MHLSMLILPGGRGAGWPKKFGQRKGLFVRISNLPSPFTVRIPSKKIYISTICNVRMMSERIAQSFRNLSVWRSKLAKLYSGLFNPPIHQSEWHIKATAVSESLIAVVRVPYMVRCTPLIPGWGRGGRNHFDRCITLICAIPCTNPSKLTSSAY